jgi:hypothetical protein
MSNVVLLRSPRFTDPVSDEERLELFQIYLSCCGLHVRTFEECLKVQVILGCLRNTLVAKKRAMAARRKTAAQAVESFELTS